MNERTLDGFIELNLIDLEWDRMGMGMGMGKRGWRCEDIVELEGAEEEEEEEVD